MKKILAVLLAFILVITIAACGKKTGGQDETTAAGSTAQTTGTPGTTGGSAPTKGPEPTVPAGSTAAATQEATKPAGSGTTAATQGAESPLPSTPATTPPTGIPEVTVPAHTHEYVSKITNATCTADGYTQHTCSCGASYTDSITKATGHTFGEWKTTKEPTTSATGTAERKCNICSEKETKTLGMLVENHKHSYTSTVTAVATCAKTGVKTYKCSCGDTYTESIAKTEHNYSTTVTNPTCTSDGYTTYTCNCGASYNGAKTSALGHSYKDSVTQPTCEDGGYTTHTCDRCGISYIDTRTNATGHNYSTAQTKAPTCTASGMNTHTCATCKHSYTTPIAAIGHSYYVSSDTKATCTTDGKKTETCRNCGDNKTVATYPATGHQHTRKEETDSTCSIKGYVKTICIDCGQTISTTEKALLSHNYAKEMILSEAVKALQNKGNSDYGRWIAYSEWKVTVCANCGVPNMDSMHYAYTAMEAAQIMLGYVNDLRAEVYGSHDYDMEVNEYLMGIAEIRAKEIVTNYSHNTETPKYGAYENIASTNAATPLKSMFEAWKNSSGHYQNMIDSRKEHFAFAMLIIEGGDWYSFGDAYGVQLFWDWYSLYEYERIHGLL